MAELILLVIVACVIAFAVLLWMIKEYYWTKEQKERRCKQGKKDWLS